MSDIQSKIHFLFPQTIGVTKVSVFGYFGYPDRDRTWG